MAIVIDGSSIAEETSWIDQQILDLIAEAEGDQGSIYTDLNDILDLVEDSLDDASDESDAGSSDLDNTVIDHTSLVLIEVDEEVNEETLVVVVETNEADEEVVEETDDQTWKSERGTSMVLIEINADIDHLVDEVRETNESTLAQIGEWLSDFTDQVHSTLWGWIPELTNDAAIYLAALPARLLFEAFKDFFFEETE